MSELLMDSYQVQCFVLFIKMFPKKSHFTYLTPLFYSLGATTGALQGHAVVRVEIGQVMISSETGFYLRC